MNFFITWLNNTDLTQSVRGAEDYDKWMQENADKLNPDGTLKEGWERDWKNGGKLVWKGEGSPDGAGAGGKTAKDLAQEDVDRIRAENEAKRRDLQMQIDTKNEEYKNVPAKYQSQIDELEAKKLEAQGKADAKQRELDALQAEKDKIPERRNALNIEYEAGNITEDEYDERSDAIRADRRRLTSQISAIESEYYGYYSDIDSYNVQIRGIERKIADERSRLMADVRSLDDDIRLLYAKEKDLGLDITYVGDSMERFTHIEDFRAIRSTLRENTTFEFDTYSSEMVKMVQRMDADALTVQKSLSEAIKKSNYNTGKGGKGGRTVSMTMSKNHHEVDRGNGLKGSWGTKYHEEGHVLDHLLRDKEHTDFIRAGTKGYNYSSGGYMLGFLDTRLEYGEKALDAIGADILSFINQAIDWVNTAEHTQYKPQNGLNRISSDSKYATIRFLRHLVDDEGIKTVDMSMLTDAIGCYTNGNLHPWAHGFYGHDKTYCKDGGKQMSVAESWATFNYVREVATDEEKDLMRRLMPDTYSFYEATYHTIAEYLRGGAKLKP